MDPISLTYKVTELHEAFKFLYRERLQEVVPDIIYIIQAHQIKENKSSLLSAALDYMKDNKDPKMMLAIMGATLEYIANPTAYEIPSNISSGDSK